MKRALMIFGVAFVALAVAGGAAACDGKKVADNSEAAAGCCAKAVAKAAYDQALDNTGCEKTAAAAYNTIARTVQLKTVPK